MKSGIRNIICSLAVFFLLQALSMAVMTAIFKLSGTPSAGNSYFTIASSALFGVLALVVFLSMKWSVLQRHYLQTRPWDTLFWCVVAALGMVLPSSYLQELLPLPNLIEENLKSLVGNQWGYLVIGLLVPFAEEVVFRGAVLRMLLGIVRRRWVAIVLSALIFSLAHLNPAQMPHAFLAGLLLGWLYARTDSIIPGVAFHWTNNVVAFFLATVMPDPDAPLVVLFGGDQHAVYWSMLFSMMLFLPAIFQLNLRLRR